MRFTRVISTAAALAVSGVVLGTLPALAQSHNSGPKIYAVHSSANYCPAGLQPVTISGEICCGRPNQSMTYQQVMAHPVATRHVRRASAACAVGTKGCTFD
jgi:hypothetical protein